METRSQQRQSIAAFLKRFETKMSSQRLPWSPSRSHARPSARPPARWKYLTMEMPRQGIPGPAVHLGPPPLGCSLPDRGRGRSEDTLE